MVMFVRLGYETSFSYTVFKKFFTLFLLIPVFGTKRLSHIELVRR